VLNWCDEYGLCYRSSESINWGEKLMVCVDQPLNLQSKANYRCEMTNIFVKELVDFFNAFQILPRHVSASGCHLQGVLGAI
jgi:hypothetical protein